MLLSSFWPPFVKSFLDLWLHVHMNSAVDLSYWCHNDATNLRNPCLFVQSVLPWPWHVWMDWLCQGKAQISKLAPPTSNSEPHLPPCERFEFADDETLETFPKIRCICFGYPFTSVEITWVLDVPHHHHNKTFKGSILKQFCCIEPQNSTSPNFLLIFLDENICTFHLHAQSLWM